MFSAIIKFVSYTSDKHLIFFDKFLLGTDRVFNLNIFLLRKMSTKVQAKHYSGDGEGFVAAGWKLNEDDEGICNKNLMKERKFV